MSKLRAHPLPCAVTRQRSDGVAPPGVADGARVALPGVADDARGPLAGVTGVFAACRRGALGGVPFVVTPWPRSKGAAAA